MWAYKRDHTRPSLLLRCKALSRSKASENRLSILTKRTKSICLSVCLSVCPHTVQRGQCVTRADQTAGSGRLKFAHHLGEVTGQCRVQKRDRWDAEVARGTSWKNAFFAIALTWGKQRVKFVKNGKTAKHGCGPGPISGQPGVRLARDKHG